MIFLSMMVISNTNKKIYFNLQDFIEKIIFSLNRYIYICKIFFKVRAYKSFDAFDHFSILEQ